jgi:protein-tyrosine phosphatase
MVPDLPDRSVPGTEPAAGSVMFVCTGNTCRSPIAEQVLRRALAEAGLTAEVGSCGLRAAAAGGPADPRAQEVLRVHGFGFDHAVRQFDPEMFGCYELIIALDSMHQYVLRHVAPDEAAAARVRLLGSFDPAAGAGWDVPDPVGGDMTDYERTLGLVRSAMPGILDAVRAAVAGPSG